MISSSPIQNLGYLSTEKRNPITNNLSQTFEKSCLEGLKILHQADLVVFKGFKEFATRNDYEEIRNKISNSAKKVFLGCGSSARAGADLAAKFKDQGAIAIIAGGDSAFFRAIEGAEDDENEGKKAITEADIGENDVVFLSSASSSAPYNRGAAKEARNRKATVYYFYNSTETPEKTKELFDHYGVIPLLIDIGPQAITGSTRLQAATLAELCLGSLFLKTPPLDLVKKIEEGNSKILQQLSPIEKIIRLEHQVFSNPEANFFREKDETNKGYVSFIAPPDSLREVVTDTVETSPTFTTNPPRTPKEVGKKRAEFQAFIPEKMEEETAWIHLLGREVNHQDWEKAKQFSMTETGFNHRPTGEGNLVIGVAKKDPSSLLPTLEKVKKQGAKIALIVLSDWQKNVDLELDSFVSLGIKEIGPSDITSTILLKQILNMISNGSMIRMKKVHGNQMIDLNPANNKLIDRAARLVLDLFKEYGQPLNRELSSLYPLITQIRDQKRTWENEKGYTPSAVKIATTMLHRNVDFAEAVQLLRLYQENLSKIFEEKE